MCDLSVAEGGLLTTSSHGLSSVILRGSSTLLSLLLSRLRPGESSLVREDTLFLSLVLVGQLDWETDSFLVQDTTFMLTAGRLSEDWIT